MKPRLSPTVLWLGVVSLLTDAAGEMIFPLMPLFLTGVLGAPLPYVGLIEGAAESTASLLKIYFGRLSDRLPRRKPLVVFGYGLAGLVRPLMGLAQGPLQVLLIRLADRFGKGVRSSPRDALLADATPRDLRGRAYGFHRAMDNLGAVLGPLCAFTLLGLGLGLRQVFLWALVPGALALITVAFLVRERPREVPPALSGPGVALSEVPARAPLPGALRRYYLALLLFSLGNSSDAFLLVWARGAGVPQAHIPLLWMVHNGIKSALNVPLGALSDRIGRRRLILLGWALYALIYLGFATAGGVAAAWGLMAAYAVYYGLLEGAEKALVADLSPPHARGRAFGWFHGIVGLAALPASLLCGLLYNSGAADGTGPLRAFGLGAALSALAALVLATVKETPRSPPGSASS